MFSMLLAETGTTWVNYVLIGVVALLLIGMPIMMNARNKKESQKVQEQTNSLKVGDKVMTTSGVYGTITELKFDDTQKLVVIETGGKTKSYLSIDAYAIYTVFKSEEQKAQDLANNQAEKEKEEKIEEVKVVENKEEVSEEKKPAKRKKKETTTENKE